MMFFNNQNTNCYIFSHWHSNDMFLYFFFFLYSMKKLLIAVFALLLINSLFSVDACKAGFSDNVAVLVVDAKYRPVEGAAVTYKFQVDYTTSKGYFTTPPFYTNSEGKTSYIVTNQEIQQSKVDCNIIINASYGTASTTKKIIAEAHEKTVLVKLNIYNVFLQLTDQNAKKLEGVQIFIDGLNETTDSKGFALFKLKVGNLTAYIKYKSGGTEKKVEVLNDAVKTLELGIYPFTLIVQDDNGNKLSAIATVTNESYNVVDGTLKLNELITASPVVIVYYKNMEKSVAIDLSLKSEYFVFFDLTPPVITSIGEPLTKTKTIQIEVSTKDPGLYASGISTTGVVWQYEINKSGIWDKATVFQQKKDIFIIEIPKQSPGSRIDFILTVTDKEGNSNEKKGIIMLPGQEVQDISNNEDKKPEQLIDRGSFPWLAVIGILIVLIVIFMYFKAKGGEEN